MAASEGRWRCVMRWLGSLAIVVGFSGCQTATPSLFTTAGPGWRVQQGQALWRPAKQYPELGGELVLATHPDGRSMIEFSKTPLPLVLAQTTRTNWLIRFPPRRMGFQGRGTPPARFAWLYLSAALAGAKLPSALRFDPQPNGGWRLTNVRSGETVEGFLEP